MSTIAPVQPGRHRSTERPPTARSEVPARHEAGSRAGRLGRGLRRAGSVLVTTVLVVAMAGFLFLAIGPHLLGYRTSTMLTGSMEPMIAPGDVVVTKPVPATEIEVGDVVTYRIPVDDHRIETHRVVEVSTADGEVTIRTKGDANKGVDPWTAVVEGDTMYEVQAVVPYVGKAIRALHNPWVSKGVLWIAVGGMIVLGFLQIWGRTEDDEDDEAETS
ncbi:signal peptidase I [Nocardioides sp. zg-DK7169]|uniref:signal peptidase I n=1 Tax=Nocardioides sp. zg-DK7169 TaxID=2736600 RepID=UPI001C1310F2